MKPLTLVKNPFNMCKYSFERSRYFLLRGKQTSRITNHAGRVTFRVMKFGRYVTVDDGGNLVTFLLTRQSTENPELCSMRYGDEFGLELN